MGSCVQMAMDQCGIEDSGERAAFRFADKCVFETNSGVVEQAAANNAERRIPRLGGARETAECGALSLTMCRDRGDMGEAMKIQAVMLWGIGAVFYLGGCAPDLKTTGTGGAGGSGGESASSSGMPGAENCSDGIDNDGDTLTDCADTMDCGEWYSCNAAPPAGWTYVHIRRLDYGTALVPCADGRDPERFFQEPEKSSCSSCNCQVVGDCSSTISCFSDLGCLGSSGNRTLTTEGQCSALMGGVTLQSCKIEGTGNVPAMATCTATGGVASAGDPFGKEIHVCPAAVDAEGCGGQTCLGALKMPYENRLCVMQAGADTCPEGFTENHSTFGSYTDTRACSPCACDSTQIKCAGPTTVNLWGDAICTTNGQVVATANGCVNLTSNPTYISTVELPNLSVPKAACTGGAATGAVIGADPTKICCAKP